MTETTGYLGNHPNSHLQHWSNQLWLKPTVTDRSFSEAGNFSKSSYPVLVGFDSLFSCILLVRSVHHALCQWLRHGQFLAQRPVVPSRKQTPSGVSLVLNILSGIDQCCQKQLCLMSTEL